MRSRIVLMNCHTLKKWEQNKITKYAASLLPYMYCMRFCSGTICFFNVIYDKRKVKHTNMHIEILNISDWYSWKFGHFHLMYKLRGIFFKGRGGGVIKSSTPPLQAMRSFVSTQKQRIWPQTWPSFRSEERFHYCF